MGKTIAEKIFSIHSNQDLRAGDLVVTELDFCSGTDAKSGLALNIFKDMQAEVKNPNKISLIIDHFVPCGHSKWANDHKLMRSFAKKNGITVYDAGDGICHQILMEKGHSLPGTIIGVGDSHAPSAGAVNCFAVAVGSSEIAAIIATNKLWFKVPESIKIDIVGQVPEGVYAKDIILHILGKLGPDGANYKAIEFHGSVVSSLEVEERITICNMVVDAGAKTAIMEYDNKVEQWLRNKTKVKYNPVYADSDALYAQKIKVDVSVLTPQISCPHSVDNVSPIEKVAGTVIQQAFIGSCTNGRLTDIAIAASILEGKKVHPDVRFIITPGSRQIYSESLAAGYIKILIEAGVQIMTPACGPCAGVLSQQGVPADGEAIITAANRNFKGRAGNENADIYLASPATVAVSALNGCITDPRIN